MSHCFREDIHGGVGWMSSSKGQGRLVPSRNMGVGLSRSDVLLLPYCYHSLYLKGGRRRGGVRWYSPLEGRREGCSAPVWEGGDLVGGGIVNLIRKEGKL